MTNDQYLAIAVLALAVGQILQLVLLFALTQHRRTR